MSELLYHVSRYTDLCDRAREEAVVPIQSFEACECGYLDAALVTVVPYGGYN